eukprot:m.176703 g.176703  ORF g.176703 m.176703 type:complete len:369 (-) comp16563_c0_seq7:1491-2597(-)
MKRSASLAASITRTPTRNFPVHDLLAESSDCLVLHRSSFMVCLRWQHWTNSLRGFALLQHRFPFSIVQGEEGQFAFAIPDRDKPISPQQVGAEILTKLKVQAEHHVKRSIRQAVLAVPAEFDGRQRNATIQAAKLAGLRVLRLVTEPTAAALAYGLHNKSDVDKIMVFDFGGGTLDVSILHVEGGVFTTIAVAGDKRLGGEDLSHALFEFVLSKVEATAGQLTQKQQQELRGYVEVAKLRLSDETSTTIKMQVGSEDVSVEVTRQDFEKINAPIFDRVLQPVHQALQLCELQATDIDEVVLVGGSTRVPKVRELLSNLFGKDPNHEINPDEAVARGVAMQAGILSGAWPLQVTAIEPPFIDRVEDEST